MPLIAFINVFVEASFSCDEQHFERRSFQLVGISCGQIWLFLQKPHCPRKEDICSPEPRLYQNIINFKTK